MLQMGRKTLLTIPKGYHLAMHLILFIVLFDFHDLDDPFIAQTNGASSVRHMQGEKKSSARRYRVYLEVVLCADLTRLNFFLMVYTIAQLLLT